MRDLRWHHVHLRVRGFGAGAGRFVSVRRRLPLRRDVQLHRLPRFNRTYLGNAVTNAGTARGSWHDLPPRIAGPD
jgi:hypothetical protein